MVQYLISIEYRTTFTNYTILYFCINQSNSSKNMWFLLAVNRHYGDGKTARRNHVTGFSNSKDFLGFSYEDFLAILNLTYRFWLIWWKKIFSKLVKGAVYPSHYPFSLRTLRTSLELKEKLPWKLLVNIWISKPKNNFWFDLNLNLTSTVV